MIVLEKSLFRCSWGVKVCLFAVALLALPLATSGSSDAPDDAPVHGSPSEPPLHRGKTFGQWEELLITELDPGEKNRLIKHIVYFADRGFEEEVFHLLKPMCTSKHRSVRVTAIRAMKHGGPRAVPILTKLIENSVGSERFAALSSLASFGHQAVDASPTILGVIHEQEGQTRAQLFLAFRTLGRIAAGNNNAIAELDYMSRHENRLIRTQAAVALAHIAKPHQMIDATAALIESLADEGRAPNTTQELLKAIDALENIADSHKAEAVRIRSALDAVFRCNYKLRPQLDADLLNRRAREALARLDAKATHVR